jgi:hypothetical protein
LLRKLLYAAVTASRRCITMSCKAPHSALLHTLAAAPKPVVSPGQVDFL